MLLLVCSLACSPGELCFSSYCFCWLFGKDKYIITPCHRGSGLTRWSPEQGRRGQRNGDESELRRPSGNYFIDWKSLEVDSTWPSLVSMVLMRTFLVVVSIWGLESIIVSKKKKKEKKKTETVCSIFSAQYIYHIPAVKSTCRLWSYLSGLEMRS